MTTTDESLSTAPTDRQLHYIPVEPPLPCPDPLEALRDLTTSLLDRLSSVASSLARIADHMADCAAANHHLADKILEHEAAIRRLHLSMIQATYRETEQ